MVDRQVSLMFAADCELLASGSRDKSVRLWNWSVGQTVATLKLPSSASGRGRQRTDDHSKQRVWTALCWLRTDHLISTGLKQVIVALNIISVCICNLVNGWCVILLVVWTTWTSLFIFYHAMLCIRSTSHGPVSVCPSVCPSQVRVLLKRLNVGSHKQHHTIAQGL